MASDIYKYDAPSPRAVLGLRENLPQFTLLVTVNARAIMMRLPAPSLASFTSVVTAVNHTSNPVTNSKGFGCPAEPRRNSQK